MKNQLQTLPAEESRIQRLLPSGLKTIPDEITQRIVRLGATSGGQALALTTYLCKYGVSISQMDRSALLAALMSLQLKMGVTEKNLTDPEQLAETVTVVQDKYKELTHADLIHATDLLFAEELAREPGKPLKPTDHYQNFSLAFVCEWLNAYRRFRIEAVRTALRLLPPPVDPEPTPYDRMVSEVRFRALTVLPAFELFGRDAAATDFHVAYPEIFSLLEKTGIYAMPPVRKWATLKAAKVILKHLKKSEGVGAVVDYLDGQRKGESAEKARIRRVAMTLACKQAFSALEKADLAGLLGLRLSDAFTPKDVAFVVKELKEGADPAELPYPFSVVVACVHQSLAE